jgi:hypothetical protein
MLILGIPLAYWILSLAICAGVFCWGYFRGYKVDA